MLLLVDTGILLRLLDRTDPQHKDVRDAAVLLRQRGHRGVITPQNAAEFWNVCIRLATARGGLGLISGPADESVVLFAPTGRGRIAQGNALGKRRPPPLIYRPERARQDRSRQRPGEVHAAL